MFSEYVLTRSGAEKLLGLLPPRSCVISARHDGSPVAWWIDEALGYPISGDVPAGTSVADFRKAWCDEHPGAAAASFEGPSGDVDY